MKYTCWFSDTDAADPALVGGKGANLSRLVTGGFPVPPGYCVTADAYRYLLNVTGLNPIIMAMAEGIDFTNPLEISDRAARIRELIEQQPIPTEIAAEILENYFNLGREMEYRHLEATAVAVRSSATAEDLPSASFAGQQDTFLNVRGSIALLQHVRRCWSSLWSERALIYRHRQGFDHQRVFAAVVVQAMINPQVSGVLFTTNPLNGRHSETVINASWGLGEAIVSGIVTPDTLVVDKQEGCVIRQEIAVKDRRIVYASFAGAVEEDVPQEKCRQSALSPRQAAHLTALASRIEQHFAAPQDIEWALQDDRWYILQARPITTLDKCERISDREGTYSRAMFVEIFPDGLTPSFLSVINPLLANMLRAAFREIGFAKQPMIDPVNEFLNQPYLNVNYIEEVLRDMDPQLRKHLSARFSNIFAEELEGQSLSLSQIKMVARLLRFTRRFRRDFPALLAAYHGEISRIEDLQLEELSDGELLANVRHICYEGAGPLLNNDFLLIVASGVYRTLLARLLRPAFGEDAEDMINHLLCGVSGNVIMDTNNLIWDLAQTARSEPQVTRTILETDPAEIIQELKKLPQSAKFLAQLDQLLDECGHRESRFDICYPTWGEDPSPVLAFVRGYLEVEGAEAPALREKALVAQREAMTREVWAKLDKSLSGRFILLPLFRILLNQAQWLVRERDTMHYEWTRLFPVVRRVLLEIGLRWQRLNLIDQPDDIFFLTLTEQEAIAHMPKPCLDLIRERKAAYLANLSGPWPEFIVDGCAKDSRPGKLPVVASALNGNGKSSNALAGIAGSPGHAAGPARIILGPQDFHMLKPGEILVAQMTNPTWTPLFAIAGGIVTEVGGVLSHGAIVAREYGIPAVLSANGVTGFLNNGDMITVDGHRGLVIRAPRTQSHETTQTSQTSAVHPD
ncbi:MAG: PEP/pyruvate-binding domain-containing protein [Candidatus Promineifilaceae bacterium]